MMSVSKSLNKFQLPSQYPLLTYLLGFIQLHSLILPEEGWAHLGWMGPGCTNGPGAYL
jgi:hypothetical protein